MVSTLTLYRDQLNKKMNQDNPKAAVPLSRTPQTFSGTTPPCFTSHSDYATVNVSAANLTPVKLAQALIGNIRDQPTMKELAQYAWYHGSIPRQKAESLLVKEGDFLVRDSTSKPGDFVLTVHSKGSPMHFVINKKFTMHSPGSPPLIEYRFEEGLFDKPTDLILHYLENKKPITELSGVVISQPVMRAVPLEFYDPKPASPYPGSSPMGSPWHSPGVSPKGSPRMKPKINRGIRAGSQPLLSFDDDSEQEVIARKSSMPSLVPKHTSPQQYSSSNGSDRKQSSANLDLCHFVQRGGSDPALSPMKASSRENLISPDDSLVKLAPPKPSRIPTIKKHTSDRPLIQIRNQDLYEDDGRDYSDYDQIKSWPGHLSRSEDNSSHGQGLQHNATKLNNSNQYDIPKHTIRNTENISGLPKNMKDIVLNNDKKTFTFPDVNIASTFDLAMYESEILTPNNKPLEPSAVSTIKSLLLDSNSKMLAQHLTCLDLDMLKVLGTQDFGLGVTSGLELVTLPHGHRYRQDLIDRYECLSLFVALTILMCSQPMDRTQMLHKWIQIAVEMRGQLGNMFSFSAIMDGLRLPQIVRLKRTWLLLRQHFSDGAFIYEHRLLSLLSALDNASATLPLQNITLPHIMPLVRLLERDFTDIHSLLKWEEDQTDFGLDMVLAHLDTARIVTQQCNLYRVTAESIMQNFVPRSDISDLFRTEMHQKLLWGSRGAGVNLKERLSKFPAVLDLLSQRVESSEDISM